MIRLEVNFKNLFLNYKNNTFSLWKNLKIMETSRSRSDSQRGKGLERAGTGGGGVLYRKEGEVTRGLNLNTGNGG